MKLLMRYLILSLILTLLTSCTSQGDSDVSFIATGIWAPQFDTPSLLFNGSRSIVAMPTGQIWFGDGSALIKYDPDSKKITQYTVQAEKGSGAPLKLLATHDGELWGLDFLYQGKGASDPERSHQPEWILRRYDSRTDTFIEVRDPDGILYTSIYGLREIVEDKSGSFWILIHSMDAVKYPLRVIYSKLIYYDRRTGKAVEINLEQDFSLLSLDNYVGHIALDTNGLLWLSVAAPLSNETEPNFYWKVVSYNPKTKKVIDYGYPLGAQYPDPPKLFFDHNGRLWTSAIAWLDFPPFGKPVWTPIVRPSELVTNTYSPSGFSWEEPFYIYETSDGNYWVGSMAGLQVYDPHKNLWYHVDDFGYYGVVEDMHHQIWYVANGQIFKLANSP